MPLPPAIKYAVYSAMTLLPGEDSAAYDALHARLVAEFNPRGVLEEEIVSSLARLLWRRRNLATLRKAKLARERASQFRDAKWKEIFAREGRPYAAEEDALLASAIPPAREELGELYELVEAGAIATTDGLLEELATQERLDGQIDRCIKRLLFLRGLKSMAQSTTLGGAPQIEASPAPA
jgi:hypothetical protein